VCGHAASVNKLCFTAQQHRLITASDDHKVKVCYFTVFLCSHLIRLHYESCLSVPLSVCPILSLSPNSKTKRWRKNEIGVNVSRGTSNLCAIFLVLMIKGQA